MESTGQPITTFEYSGDAIDWVKDMPEWKRFEEHCEKLRISIDFTPKFIFHQDTPPDKAMWAARELMKRLVLAAETTLAKGVVKLEQEIKKAKAQGRNPVYPVFKSNQSLTVTMPPVAKPQEEQTEVQTIAQKLASLGAEIDRMIEPGAVFFAKDGHRYKVTMSGDTGKLELNDWGEVQPVMVGETMVLGTPISEWKGRDAEYSQDRRMDPRTKLTLDKPDSGLYILRIENSDRNDNTPAEMSALYDETLNSLAEIKDIPLHSQIAYFRGKKKEYDERIKRDNQHTGTANLTSYTETSTDSKNIKERIIEINRELLKKYLEQQEKNAETRSALENARKTAITTLQDLQEKNNEMLMMLFSETEGRTEYDELISESLKMSKEIIDTIKLIEQTRGVDVSWLSSMSRITGFAEKYFKISKSQLPPIKAMASLQKIMLAATVMNKVPGIGKILSYYSKGVDFAADNAKDMESYALSQNKQYAEIGQPALYPGAYMGGDPVNSFMWSIYKNPDGIKHDDREVKSALLFFSENKVRFQKFTGTTIPDPRNFDAFRDWANANKDRIWILLHGNMDNPDKQRN